MLIKYLLYYGGLCPYNLQIELADMGSKILRKECVFWWFEKGIEGKGKVTCILIRF